jgi:hypothetical protein
MKRSLSAIAALLLLSFVSCGQTSQDKTANTDDSSSKSIDSISPADNYDYPDVDYEGAEYRILNFDQLWNMFIHIDCPEQNGEILNDAVYTRNRKVEDMLNCKIIEKTFENNSTNTISRITDLAKNTILAGDDTYDVMFLPVSENIELITGGYLIDLLTIPELKLNEEWWDKEVNSRLTIRDSLYCASGSINLMAYDSMWCLFFNENMMEKNKLDLPYDLVREGKWTIDRLAEYCKAVASLNGDENFTYRKDGKCVWGISSHTNAPQHFYFCANESSVEPDENGGLKFMYQSERFYNVIEKLASLLKGTEGYTLKANNTDFDADNGGYVYVFTTGRSLFMTGEIKAAQLMRGMDDNFGIVPFPKYDEAQENYVTDLVAQLFYFTIPVTNTNLSRTATITEVLTHESFTDVIPLYYKYTVEQKGLRNEDSIEMLDIMRKTRKVDIGVAFKWENSIRTILRDKLFSGDSNVASDIAANKSAIEGSIKKFFDFIDENKRN